MNIITFFHHFGLYEHVPFASNLNFSFLSNPNILLLCLCTGHDNGALTDLGISNHARKAAGSNSSCSVWIIVNQCRLLSCSLSEWSGRVTDAHCILFSFCSCHHQFLGSALSYQFSCHCVQICPKDALWWCPQDTKYFKESKNFQIIFQFIFFPASSKMEALYYRITYIIYLFHRWTCGGFFS